MLAPPPAGASRSCPLKLTLQAEGGAEAATGTDWATNSGRTRASGAKNLANLLIQISSPQMTLSMLLLHSLKLLFPELACEPVGHQFTSSGKHATRVPWLWQVIVSDDLSIRLNAHATGVQRDVAADGAKASGECNDSKTSALHSASAKSLICHPRVDREGDRTTPWNLGANRPYSPSEVLPFKRPEEQ